jgi:hypothetical protein
MKTLLRLLMVIACCSAWGATPNETFQAALSSWEDALHSPVETPSNFLQLETAWGQLPESEKKAVWPRMAMAYVDQSEQKLDAKNANEAGKYLALAGQLNQAFGGRLEYATKTPGVFFERLARLQTAITSQTDADPLAGMVDYLFEKNGDQYLVARQELDPEVNGVTIDGVSESESLVQVHYLEARGGNVTFEKTRWFIGPKGHVAETLRHATREVLQDQYGRYEPKPLQAPVSSIPTASKAGSVPTAAQPSAAVAATLAPSMPLPNATAIPTVAAEKTGTTGFLIVPVVIVAAVIVGVAVFFLRRKS